jgi:DNA processing protein
VAYPPENDSLFKQIAERGAVISEFPMGSSPLRENFLRRNRIISGLSRGVLVVEADIASGALITARLACESHNRPVMAIPGRVDNAMSAGPHALIRDGATLVTNLNEIIESLGPLPHDLVAPSATIAEAGGAVGITDSAPVTLSPAAISLDEWQKKVVETCDSNPTSLDAIIARTEFPAERVLQALTLLSLRGIVKRVDGQNYVSLLKNVAQASAK